MIDDDIISKIEKALGFKLYPAVIRYLNTNEQYLWSGRACGRTTAYILRLVLQKDMTIELKDLRRGKYTDEIHGPNYNFWFYNEFLKIRSLLMSEGIEVIKINGGWLNRTGEIKDKDTEINRILKSSVISDKNVCTGMTKIIIQSSCRIREDDLEEIERKLSEKLGVKVVMLNGGMEIVAIEVRANNG